MDQEKFDIALKTFIEGCQNIHTDHMMQHYAHLVVGRMPDIISIRRGKRYIKIIRARPDGTSAGIHCFVDMTNGDVLKAASWKAPAKHARGNIFDGHNGLGMMHEYGPAYLR